MKIPFSILGGLVAYFVWASTFAADVPPLLEALRR